MITRQKLLFLTVRHCQLSCKGCGAQSEHAKPQFSDLDQFRKDIETLSKFMKFDILLLSGGEPLLHKQILDFIKTVRQFSICSDLRIQTNGGLLYKQPDEFWELIDSIDLSLYPNSGIDNDKVLKEVIEKCNKFNVKLLCDYKENFIQVYYQGKQRDKSTIQKIYDECGLRPDHAILDSGKLYKCVGPLVLNTTDDGVELVESKVDAYFKSNKPLNSCDGCLALTGEVFPHEQVKKNLS